MLEIKSRRYTDDLSEVIYVAAIRDGRGAGGGEIRKYADGRVTHGQCTKHKDEVEAALCMFMD